MIFQEFFDRLRAEGVPVSLNEWMSLLAALRSGAGDADLLGFYRVARAVLVKDEAFYDRFDRAFLIVFKEAEPPAEILERILQAMDREFRREFTDEEKKLLAALPLEQVMRNFMEQLRKGNFHKHEGGTEAIGRRGTSTQGADGFNPAGIRIGQSEGGQRQAVQIAEFRRFREYDPHRVLDTRGMRVALSRLRRMMPDGPPEEVDIDQTVDRTAREGGEIEIVLQPRRRNTQKILLLTDVGGSMSGYADLVSRFFSAMRGEIRELVHLYFHNCVYQHLYEDAARRRTLATHEVVEKYGHTHMLVLVGDAAMAPTELTHIGGAIDLWEQNPRPGCDYLQDLRAAFRDAAWLNPEPQRSWDHIFSVNLVRGVFPMFPLTQDGMVEAVDHLMHRRRAA